MAQSPRAAQAAARADEADAASARAVAAAERSGAEDAWAEAAASRGELTEQRRYREEVRAKTAVLLDLLSSDLTLEGFTSDKENEEDEEDGEEQT